MIALECGRPAAHHGVGDVGVCPRGDVDDGDAGVDAHGDLCD